MNTWRAGCGESRTSGSEGGPGKPTSRKADRAPRSDPYTYCRTWAGFVYVALVVDVFAQKIVAWHASTSKATDLVMIPLRIALWQRDRDGHPVVPGELIQHSDAGSQGGFKWSSQHLQREVCHVVNEECPSGWSSAAGCRLCDSTAVAVPGAAAAGPGGRACVLAVDRRWGPQRGRGGSGRRVACGRQPLVSRRWRDVTDLSGRAHGPVPVFRRA